MLSSTIPLAFTNGKIAFCYAFAFRFALSTSFDLHVRSPQCIYLRRVHHSCVAFRAPERFEFDNRPVEL